MIEFTQLSENASVLMIDHRASGDVENNFLLAFDQDVMIVFFICEDMQYYGEDSYLFSESDTNKIIALLLKDGLLLESVQKHSKGVIMSSRVAAFIEYLKENGFNPEHNYWCRKIATDEE